MSEEDEQHSGHPLTSKTEVNKYKVAKKITKAYCNVCEKMYEQRDRKMGKWLPSSSQHAATSVFFWPEIFSCLSISTLLTRFSTM